MLCVFCHVFDDYFLQGCLANLKQKSWWDKQLEHETEVDKTYYSHDYIMALVCHAMSWSVSIMVPLIYTQPHKQLFYVVAFVINTALHAWVDDLKANRRILNLVQDQYIHFLQIIITVLSWNYLDRFY